MADDETAADDQLDVQIEENDEEVVPKELFADNPNKYVYVCPICSERAQFTNGRIWDSAEDAEEFIEAHIAIEHEDD